MTPVAENINTPAFGEKLFAVFVLLYSTSAFFIFLPGAGDAEAGAWTGRLITNVVWTLIYGWTFFLLRHRCHDAFTVIKGRQLWLLLLPVPVALLSVTWSQDRYLTLLHGATLVGTTLIALYFATRFTLKEFLELSAWGFGIVTASSLVFAVFIPKYGVDTYLSDGDWLGVFGQKNTLGGAMAVSFLVYLVLACCERWHRGRRLLAAGICFLIILRANSVTPLVVCIVLLGVLWATKRIAVSKGRIWFRRLTTGLVALAVVFGISLHFEEVVNALGRDPLLTGRVFLWSVVWEQVVDKPYLGYGYGAFWRGWEGASGDIWAEMPSGFQFYSHNGVLEVWLQTGLLGVACMFIAFWGFARRALKFLKERRGVERLWPWLLLWYMIISNITEGTLVKANYYPWILYSTTAVFLCATDKLAGEAALGQGHG